MAVGEIVLVPAPAGDGGAGGHLPLGDELPARLHHAGPAGALGQVHAQLHLAHTEQVLVGVVKTGDDGAALSVHAACVGPGGGEDLLVGAHLGDDPVPDEKGLGKFLPLQVDVGVENDGFHVVSPFFG